MLEQIPIDQISDPSKQMKQSDLDIEYVSRSLDAGRIVEPSFCKIEQGSYILKSNPAPWFSAQLCQFSTIPVFVLDSDYSNYEPFAVGSELNAIDVAELNQKLIEETGTSANGLALFLGVSRSKVSHSLRLLKLIEPFKLAVREGRLSESFVRRFASFEPLIQKKLYQKYVIENRPKSIRELEAALRIEREGEINRGGKKDPSVVAYEQKLSQIIGSPVKIEGGEFKIRYAPEISGSPNDGGKAIQVLMGIIERFGLPQT